MSHITGTCSTGIAEHLAARGPVRARVQGREAIVTASVWEPITIPAAAEDSGPYVRAHLVGPDGLLAMLKSKGYRIEQQ